MSKAETKRAILRAFSEAAQDIQSNPKARQHAAVVETVAVLGTGSDSSLSRRAQVASRYYALALATGFGI
jgi:hypothetical protein